MNGPYRSAVGGTGGGRRTATAGCVIRVTTRRVGGAARRGRARRFRLSTIMAPHGSGRGEDGEEREEEEDSEGEGGRGARHCH